MNSFLLVALIIGRVFFWLCHVVAQSCLTVCDPVDCSTPGFPVLDHLPEFARAHVHWVSDAIQASCLLSSVPFSSCLQSFPASGPFLMSQFFASGGQKIGESASVLRMNIQGWFPLGLIGLISLLSKGVSRVFSSTTVWRPLFMAASCHSPNLSSLTRDRTHAPAVKALSPNHCTTRQVPWHFIHICMHVYVCMYICICVCTYVCMYICIKCHIYVLLLLLFSC